MIAADLERRPGVASPPPVGVRMLGGLWVEAAGGVLDGSVLGRRGVLVLGRLALAGPDGVPRAELLRTAWGEIPPPSAGSALRNVLTRLRRAIQANGLADALALVTTAGGYALEAQGGLRVDLSELLDLAERTAAAWHASDHHQVVRLGRRVDALADRPVLAGGDEDWVDTLRQHTSHARSASLELVAQAELALDDPAGAERTARRLVAEAPLRESAHRLLMEAQRRAGNRAQALATYEACRRALADRLGALPAPETEAVYLAILAEERAQELRPVAPPRSVAVPGPTLVAPRAPFVGREDTLAALVQRLGMVGSAGALAVAVHGEAGIGKTRIAAELAAVARREGMVALYGRADDHLSVPFGLWLQVVHQGLAGLDPRRVRQRVGHHLEVLSALAPTVADRPDPPDGGPVAGEGTQIARAIGACLQLIVGRRGGLVVLDDAQWASSGDLTALTALLADPRATPVLVLLLHRHDDDRAGIGWLGADPRVTSVGLGPLDTAALTELVRAARPAGRPAELRRHAEELRRSSGGNPLLALTLLGAEPAAAGGVPGLASPARSPDGGSPPGTVRRLVSERVAGLPGPCRRLLGLAAVAGGSFDPGLLAVATDTERAVVDAQLGAARRAGLLVDAEDGSPHLAFRHGIVREQLLEELGDAERRQAHGLVGAALEATTGTGPAPVVEMAHHLQAAESDDWRRRLRYGLTAARAASDAGVYEDVVELASRTLAVLDRAGDPHTGARIDLQVLLGAALRQLGRADGADLLRQAFAAAGADGDGARMADAALAFTGVQALGDEWATDEQLLALYQQALGVLGPEQRGRRALLLARVAGGRAWGADPAGAAAPAAEALELARQLGEARTTASVLATLRRSLSSVGAPAQLAELEAELSVLAEEIDDSPLGLALALWRFDTAVIGGQGGHLEELLEEAARHARASAWGRGQHSLAYEQASLALLRGRVEEADQLVERAALIGHRVGVDPVLVTAIRLAQLTVVRAEQGRLGELRHEAAAFFGPSGIPAWLGLVASIDASLGEAAGAGEPIRAVVEDFAACGPSGLCPPGLLAVMAAPAVRSGDPELLARLHDLLVPFSGRGGYFACFAGPIDHHLGILAHALGRREEADGRFAAAGDFARRVGAPRWQARAAAALGYRA